MEEEEVSKKKDLEKQMLLAERHDKAQELTSKFRMQHQIEQEKNKLERDIKAKQAAAQPT